MQEPLSSEEYAAQVIARARKAQAVAAGYDQARVDELVTALAWAGVKEENSRNIAKMAYEESQLGNYESKYGKLQKKIRGVLRDMKGQKSVGIVDVIPEKGLVKWVKPAGVIGALVPCTNPEATPIIKAMNAIKGRNAIVLSPHPRTKGTNDLVCGILRQVLAKHGAPEDLIIGIPQPTMEISAQLMKQCDLVWATGGGALVKAAYSSGTPAYGVGAGNAAVIIDETADLDDACRQIRLSKTFDYATSCSSENSLIIQERVYGAAVAGLEREGGHLCTRTEKELLRRAMFLESGHLNGGSGITAQSAQRIGEIAGFPVAPGVSFLMVEEDGAGAEHPFSGEKLSVVLALYRYKDFDDAVDLVNAIHQWSGKGHSCGIHSFNQEHINQLARRTFTARIMIRQGVCFGNSGNWDNGMPFTLSLGCSTWGGNISSDNMTWDKFVNTTWVSSPIPEVIPTDEELFGGFMEE